ncbi:MAG: hypothetical protein KGY69_10310 [Bacteroidales bacterium]|nr:hypothetical protein [Bacteroidales bacterium]
MQRILLLPFFMMLISLSGFSRNYELSSPDGRIKVEISVNDETQYSVYFRGNQVNASEDLSIHMAPGGGWVAKLKKE